MTDPIFVALITAGGIVVGTLLTSLINFLQGVRRIVDELERSTSPKTRCQRFQDWQAARKKKKAEQAEAHNP